MKRRPGRTKSQVNTTRAFEWIDQHLRGIRIIVAALLLIFVGGVYILVYKTGGIKFVYSHSMYLPILLAGFVFGVKGGVLIGVIGGIVLGPFMPISVISGELQRTANWLYRTGFFTLIGFLSGTASDSTRSYIRHLRWISRHDSTTHLPNRRALFEDMNEIALERKSSGSFVLTVVSLENILEARSAFGFPAVEEIIRQLAERFKRDQDKNTIYQTDTAHVSVLSITSVRGTEKIHEQLAEASGEPILYNGIPIHIDTRMGSVAFDTISESPETCLQKAEAALIMAREKGLGWLTFRPEILARAEENMTVLGGLSEAITKGQLSLHYQPKIFLRTGTVHGAEALVRWNHPEWGEIPPEAFIPRTEQSTLIQLITEFALKEALAQIVQWRRYDINVPVAVNISTRNLLQPGFTDLITRLLDQHDLGGDCLELEITEGALMIDMERSIAELAELAGLKIVISIDDFGTGYSSLQYLHKLPISLVKIDQSFVRRLPHDKGAASILEAAVVLAHKIGIKTLAEGVENMETYEYLNNIGCDMGQGYLFSPPLSAENFRQWHIQCGGRYSIAAAPLS